MNKKENRGRKTVSAIVPLLNEEKTISHVVSELLKSAFIDEVICVIDDDSTDNSRNILRDFGKKIKFIDVGKNRGKGYALCKGVEKANSEIVAFFDADITNLTQNIIEKMVTSLIYNPNIKVVLGYPPTRHSFAKLFLPLTGERTYYREDLMPHLKTMKKLGYGVEVYLNKVFEKQETKIIPLKNLFLLEKREKFGLLKSIPHEKRAAIQISKGTLITAKTKYLPKIKSNMLFGKTHQTIKKIKKKNVSRVYFYICVSAIFLISALIILTGFFLPKSAPANTFTQNAQKEFNKLFAAKLKVNALQQQIEISKEKLKDFIFQDY